MSWTLSKRNVAFCETAESKSHQFFDMVVVLVRRVRYCLYTRLNIFFQGRICPSRKSNWEKAL
jgi:hypothetical protein